MKGKIFGIVFLGWFIASIVAILLVSELENQVEWLLILFGQYFLVFGGIAVWANKEKKNFPTVILMFPLVGFGLIGSGLYMLIGGVNAVENMAKYAPYVIMAVFPIAGALMIHMAVAEMVYLKRKCTYEVRAKCVDISSHYVSKKNGGRTKVYMPTYSVWLDNKEYRIWNNKYTNSCRFVVGEYYNIKVNPLDVNEFIDGNTKFMNGGLLVIGTVFVFVTVIIIGLIIKVGGVSF